MFFNCLAANKNNRKITITGVVLDVYQSPIANATVMIDGQKTNSLTDSNGEFKVKVNRNATRIGISAFGNGLIEEAINGRTEINFKLSTYVSDRQLSQNDTTGEEEVNLGYDHIKKKYVTTDINTIDLTQNKYYKYNSIFDAIEREVSGVKIYGETIIIQDSRNLFGLIPALLVVDGVYVNTIKDILPSTVESIEVLKGTSAAIYGTRGLGGAVVIKTKTGIDY